MGEAPSTHIVKQSHIRLNAIVTNEQLCLMTAKSLGIPSAAKYEPTGENYLKKIFKLLLDYSADPITDQLKLWDMLVFNYMVGNTDNHIKNLSFVYGADLKSMRLAPAYDIVSTAVYDSCTRDMAFAIGGSLGLDEINRDAFAEAAGQVGLNPKMAMKRFDRLGNRFEQALVEAVKDLEDRGFKKAPYLKEKILKIHNRKRSGKK